VLTVTADLDIVLLLTLQAVSAKVGIRLPWEKVAEAMGPIYTEGSIVQHLAKLRTKRSSLGLPVPQPWGRGSGKANLTMATSVNVSENDEEGTGDNSEADSSHRTVKRRAPKRAPANSKKASVQDGTLTSRGKRKVDVVDDSEVKCEGAPFLEHAHEHLNHSFSPSKSEYDEDTDSLPVRRKRKSVSFHPASTKLTRFKVKKSSLAKVQLRQAQKEENALLAPTSKCEEAIDDSLDDTYPDDYPEVPSPWLESPLHMGHQRVAGPMDFNDAADPNAQNTRNSRGDTLSRKALPGLYSQASLRHNPSTHAGSLISGHDQSYLNQYGAIRNLYNISSHAAAGSGNSRSPWISRMPPTPTGSSPSVPDVSYGYAALDLLQQQAHHGAIDPRILGELDPTMPSERMTDDPPLDDTINDMFVAQDAVNEEPYSRIKREGDE
jgi:hypothetical protein